MSDQVPVERDTKFDFSGSNVSGFLKSINADTTPNQILRGKAIAGFGIPDVIITDLGGGVHEFETRGLFASNFTPAGVPVNVPSGAATVLLTLSVPSAGLWFFTGNVNLSGALGGTINVRTYLLNGASQIGESTQEVSPAGIITGFSASVISILLAMAGGETITLNCDQNNGAAAAIDLNAVINGIRLGHV